MAGRLIACIATIFTIIIIYTKHQSWLDIEWLSEGILVLSLAIVSWVYHVNREWKFEVHGGDRKNKYYYWASNSFPPPLPPHWIHLFKRLSILKITEHPAETFVAPK